MDSRVHCPLMISEYNEEDGYKPLIKYSCKKTKISKSSDICNLYTHEQNFKDVDASVELIDYRFGYIS